MSSGKNMVKKTEKIQGSNAIAALVVPAVAFTFRQRQRGSRNSSGNRSRAKCTCQGGHRLSALQLQAAMQMQMHAP